MDKNSATTIALLTAFVATVSATDIYLPSLPEMTRYFNASDDAVRLSIPIYMLGSFLMSPLWGVLSDQTGRRPVLLMGLSIFLVSTLFCVIAPTLPVLLVARFMQGVGSITVPIAGWAVIQDLFPADQSAKPVAQMGAVMVICPLLAPIVGGFIDARIGWRANFVVIFVLSAIAMISLALVIQEQRNARPKTRHSLRTSLNNYRTLFTHTTFLCYVLMYAVLVAGEWCYLTLAPFYFGNTLQLTPDVFGVYIAGAGLGFFLGSLVSTKLMERFGINNTLMIGISLTLLASLLLLIVNFSSTPSPFTIACILAIYFGGSIFVWGPSTSRALQLFEEIRGAASAVRSILFTLAGALGGAIGSILSYANMLPLSIVLIITSGASLFLYTKAKMGQPQALDNNL